MDKINLQDEYLATLNEKELKAYWIAKTHLGDSFQIEKSVGYLKWVFAIRTADKCPLVGINKK